MITHSLSQVKAMIKIRGVEIVIKNTAYTACFIAVFEVKVLVAPCLVARVVIVTKGCQCVCTCLVKMSGIVWENIIGGEVHASAKPKYRCLLILGMCHE